MRRPLAALLVASAAALTLGSFAAPASAVCGGGQPGEACYCPDGETNIKDVVVVRSPVNC